MKKVLIFTTAYTPYIGGAEIAVKEIVKELSGSYEFTVLTYRFSKELSVMEKLDGATVYRWGWGSKWDRFFLFPFWTFWKGLSLLRKDGKALLWGIMVTYASIGAYLIKLLRPKQPFLLTLQEGDSPRHLQYGKLGMLGFWWKRLLHKADRVQCISEYLAGLARDKGARGEVSVVPNGVNLEYFGKPADQYELQRYRDLYRLGAEDFVLVTVSRLSHKNGVDTCILALKHLDERFKLLVCGSGEEEKSLRKLVSENNLEHRVVFAGSVAHDRLPLHLQLARVFVRPSRSEGLGNSFLEAMAVGLPVVGTPVGGIPDFLTDRVTGLFCRPDDPADLAEKILMYEDKNLYQSIQSASRKLVGERYGWSKVAEAMREIFEGMAKK